MENVVPDNDHMSRLADSMDDLHKQMQKDIVRLRDTEGDIFMRYMAYFRSMNYVKSVEFCMNMFHKNMVAGHAITHEILQSKEAKENGWDKYRIEDNPFFINPDDKDDDDDKPMPDFLKKLLARVIFEAISDKKKETH